MVAVVTSIRSHPPTLVAVVELALPDAVVMVMGAVTTAAPLATPQWRHPEAPSVAAYIDRHLDIHIASIPRGTWRFINMGLLSKFRTRTPIGAFCTLIGLHGAVAWTDADDGHS